MTFRLTLIKTEFPLLRRSQSWYTIPDRYVSFRLSMLCCKIFTVKLCAALQVAQIFDVDRNLEVLGARVALFARVELRERLELFFLRPKNFRGDRERRLLSAVSPAPPPDAEEATAASISAVSFEVEALPPPADAEFRPKPRSVATRAAAANAAGIGPRCLTPAPCVKLLLCDERALCDGDEPNMPAGTLPLLVPRLEPRPAL